MPLHQERASSYVLLLTSRLRDFAASGHSRLPGEAEYEDKDDICVDDIYDGDDDGGDNISELPCAIGMEGWAVCSCCVYHDG